MDTSPRPVRPDAPGTTLTGQRLGAFEIGTLIGAGGMGQVYRARDTVLGRDVAIKILPDVFAADANRRTRFEREARVLASLNHPHIAAIYGFEHREGIHGLVLELVEGQTLAARLHSGPLPVREALTIARQIAEALEAAHDKGIVHRDLKPANIALQDGTSADAGGHLTIKVLDFGLAKAVLDDSAADLLHSPTVTAGGTAEGVVLGTAAYMSPEQARGKMVDKRTDIWAFGCILWELLSGRKAFAGETVSDTLAAIFEREPDWTVLPSNTPAGVTRLLHRSLEKDPKRRLHHIADARIEIDDALAAPASDWAAARAEVRTPARRSRIVAVIAGIAAVAAAVAAIVISSRPSALAPPVRLSVFTPGLISPQLSATLSPDGRELAFVSTGESGKLMLWIRSLESGEARVLPGTENAAHPFWSPDGRFLAFLAEGKLKKIAAAGGPVDTLAEAPERFGGTWSRDDMILFPGRIGELTLIAAGGGPLLPLLLAECEQ